VLQNVCQLALTVKSSYYIQKEACNTFMKLVELFKNDLNLVTTINEFSRINELRINSIKGENTV